MNRSLPPRIYAAVDLGSNSFHMLVASYEDGQVKAISRVKDMVRLAAGLTDCGKISKIVAERALDCIENFGALTRELHADVVRAVGTSALRRATNAGDFLATGQEILGHPIAVISGKEEARLVFLGATQGLPPLGKDRLVVDIGGGSTELILGSDSAPRALHSLDMGCVGLTEEFFPGGKISEKRWQRAERAATKKLNPLRSELDGWAEAIGTSGTIRCIQRVLLGQGWSKKVISQRGMKKLQRHLIRRGHVEKLDLNGLSTRRTPVFAGGAVILGAVFSELKIDSLRATGGALREGLVYDMIKDVNPVGS